MLRLAPLIIGVLFAISEICPVTSSFLVPPSFRTSSRYIDADPAADAQILHKYMATAEPNLTAAFDLFTARSPEHRIKIVHKINELYDYPTLFRMLLPLAVDDLVDSMAALFSTLPMLYSIELDAAIDNNDTQTILEVFLSMDNTLTLSTLEEYESHFESDFLEDLDEVNCTSDFDFEKNTFVERGEENLSDISYMNNFREIIRFLSNGTRDETSNVDLDVTNRDVDRLIKMRQSSEKVNNTELIDIFINRGLPQFLSTSNIYEIRTGEPLEEFPKAKLSGPLRDRYTEIVKFNSNRIRFYAEKLKDAMRHDDAYKIFVLNRIIIGRVDIDLDQIKSYFQNMGPISLYDAVKNATSGEYQSIMLRIIGN